MICGSLEVPENHFLPASKKIKISYAVLKAKNRKPRADPVIFFSGGPGSSSLRSGLLRFLSNMPIRQDRDIIAFDQRGINHSSGLPDIGLEVFQAMAADVDIAKEQKLIETILKKYKEKFEADGIDLANYNSIQSAHDVALLMNSLKYDKYNLFGISYGTRLARLVQDMFPEKVKTVILDSPNLMTDDFLIDRITGYSRAAEKIFKFCETDKDCSAKYPNLRTDYASSIKSLQTKPLRIDVEGDAFYLNSQDAMFFLRHRLYRNDAKEAFPAFVEALKNSEKKPILEAIISEKEDVQDGGFNTSMFLAVSVFESMNEANTSDVIKNVYSQHPNFPEKLGFFTNLYQEGMKWHNGRLPISQRKFNISSIPTVIFVNQYDPVTPPENGPLFKEKLTNSRLYILDEAGHSGGDNDCKMKVMTALMDDPAFDPTAKCLRLYKPSSDPEHKN